MNEVTVGIIALGLVLILFLTGIELGFAMILIGFLGFGYLISWQASLNLLAKDFFDVLDTYSFTVIPLFVLMGQVAFNSGIAKRLFDATNKFMGHVPGGLAMATVAGATAFKSICGSSPATAATFASVAIPEMDRYGYAKKLSTGIVASVGTLGILLPPSVTLIIFGVITDQSIGRLFLAGIVPGLLVAFFFILIIYAWCKMYPEVAPKGSQYTWAERFKSLPEVIWVIFIFLLVIGGILGGFFTPTEAGSVGTFLVLVLTFAKRDLNLKAFWKAVIESLRTACMVMMLIAGSTVLGHFIAVTKIPMIAADWIVGLPFAPWVIMIFIAFIYEIGGSFIDDLAFMILATPIFYPAIEKLGYNPLWFGMMIGITVMVGVVIPPVAINVFVVKQITKVPFGVIYSGVYPFLISLVVAAILLFIFPGLATWLPGLLMPMGPHA
ncbi:MAG TPA: TRAP transporter large permease [Syntrophorhabdaceae bacterium]|nr:TRAP transporter large permease [Syntrophorhabdaceae bacterium]